MRDRALVRLRGRERAFVPSARYDARVRSLAAFALLLVACQSGAAVGTVCTRDSECASPLACRFGRCRTECAAQRDCPLGATCVLDQNGLGSCALADDPDCSLPGHGCASPLACIGRTCVNLCAEIADCPPGSSCEPTTDHRASCVRTDGQDAGPTDAGPSDAGLDAPQSFDAGTDAYEAAVAPVDANVDANGDAAVCSPLSSGSGPCDTAIDVVVDDGHSCVRSMSGRVWCWGENGTLGRDGDSSRCTGTACPWPAQVLAGDTIATEATDVERVLLSHLGGCYTTHTTGLMLCWGTHDYEAPLGTGMADGPRARTVLLGTGSPITGTDTFMVFGASAISADIGSGQWFGWGNDEGDVMHRGSVMASLDHAVGLETGWVSPRRVATSETHGCGITADGHVVCWGSNTHGESAPLGTQSSVGPTQISDTHIVGVTDIALGNTHSCALAGGQLYCWGLGAMIPGGNPCGGATDCPPTRIDTGSHAIQSLAQVSYADDLCFIEHTTDALYCWGAGYGSFGASVPTAIPHLPAVGSAWLTWSHGCAIDTNSRTWCWGQNGAGELGIGTIDALSHDASLVMFP